MKRAYFAYLTNYRFNSIFIRNMMMLMAFALLPLILTIVLSSIFYNETLRKEAAATSSMYITYIEHSLDIVTENVLTEVHRIVADSDCLAFLLRDSSKEFEQTTGNIRLMNKLGASTNLSSQVDSIYLYNRNIGLIGKNEFVIGEAASQHPCVAGYHAERAKSDGRYTQFRVYMWQGRYGMESIQYITYACPFVSDKLARSYVFVNLNLNRILNGIANEVNISQGRFVLVSDDQIVYTSGSEGLPGDAALFELARREIPETYTSIRTNGESFMVFESEIFGDSFRLLYFLPQSAVLGKVAWLQTASLWLILVVFCLSVALAYWISVRMYNPIRQLLETARRLPAADPDRRVAGNEITYIAQTLDDAYKQRIIAENELERRVEMFRKAQYAALQSQITPHFLCNTLDNINWLAIMKLGEDNEISEMSTGLARLLTMSMSTASSVHTLSEEIGHAQQYICIMKKRYVDRFEVNWFIEEGLSSVNVPKIMLQPIIENAIYHGVKLLHNVKGIIDIRISRVENLLHIEVKDNGPGFEASVARQLNDELELNCEEQDEHIGLHNVNMRLKLLFGDAYGVAVGLDEEGGGRVSLKIPL